MEDGASCVSLAIICTLCSVAANNLVISNIVDTLCATKHRQKYMLILIDVRCLSFASIRCDLNLWREKKRRSDRDLEIFRRISFFFLHVTSMCSLSIFFFLLFRCAKNVAFPFRIVWFVCMVFFFFWSLWFFFLHCFLLHFNIPFLKIMHSAVVCLDFSLCWRYFLWFSYWCHCEHCERWINECRYKKY